MISAAKLRRAQDAIIHMRPYSFKLQEILKNILANDPGDIELPLAQEREVERVLIVVITSDRGSCGGYNSNLVKLAKQLIREKYASQQAKGLVTVMPIGKKGMENFARTGIPMNNQFWNIFSDLNFERVRLAAQWILDSFLKKEVDSVELVYSEFKNAAVQRFQAEKFLPIPKARPDSLPKLKADFLFEPNQDELIRELIPKILHTQFFKAVLDAHASEHGARMMAMDKATDNAQELLKSLRLSYNRARQAAITTELTEIVSGAQALME